MKKPELIKYNLLQNALESLTHAIDHLSDCTNGDFKSNLKRVILDITQVAELLIKEALNRINPAFIWRNVDKYPSLEAQTVSTIEGLDRYSKIASIRFSNDDISAVRSCVRVRNAIQHSSFEISEAAAKIIIGRMLSFIFSFSKTHLEYDLKNEYTMDDRWISLLEFYSFNQEYSKRIKTELEQRGAIVEQCSNCEGMSFDIISEVCELCGHVEIRDEYT